MKRKLIKMSCIAIDYAIRIALVIYIISLIKNGDYIGALMVLTGYLVTSAMFYISDQINKSK